MAEGRLKHNWDETATLLASLGNLFRDPRRGSPLRASSFNPYRQERQKPERVKLRDLKEMLIASGVVRDGQRG